MMHIWDIYEDFVTSSRYLKQGWVITSRSLPWDVINCLPEILASGNNVLICSLCYLSSLGLHDISPGTFFHRVLVLSNKTPAYLAGMRVFRQENTCVSVTSYTSRDYLDQCFEITVGHGEVASHKKMNVISLQNSTWHIGGHSVHQCFYFWLFGINFGGPKKYAITKKDWIMISQGNPVWNTTEKNQIVSDATLKNHQNLNHWNVWNFETCLEKYLGNVNVQKIQMIAGLSDQHR